MCACVYTRRGIVSRTSSSVGIRFSPVSGSRPAETTPRSMARTPDSHVERGGERLRRELVARNVRENRGRVEEHRVAADGADDRNAGVDEHCGRGSRPGRCECGCDRPARTRRCRCAIASMSRPAMPPYVCSPSYTTTRFRAFAARSAIAQPPASRRCSRGCPSSPTSCAVGQRADLAAGSRRRSCRRNPASRCWMK